MRIALLSDIHANRQALGACLAHARKEGATQFAFLGDLVGYGAEPGYVVDALMELQSQGAIVLKGNHDESAAHPPVKLERAEHRTSVWTHDQLRPDQRLFLAQLPLQATIGNCLLVHASAHKPQQWRYVDDERSARESLDAALTQEGIRYVFGGHVHHQTLYYQGAGRQLMSFAPTAGVPIPTPSHRAWIATIGSVGQPRDGRPLSMYAMFDTARSLLTFHRVAYDFSGAAMAIRQAGLPEDLAVRIEEGR